MKSLCLLFAIFTAYVVNGHGDHDNSQSNGESNWEYAQRHMSSEHHIDSFDLKSFFHIHDLNRDGFWDKEEIEAVYGVHHVYSQKKSADDVAHQQKADHIVNTVLSRLDTDKDGKISPEEFEASGLSGLPNFDSLGAEGHHYDVESEFFLHHEEMYHSTPETQTDESYNHPEDIEHFAQHEQIEHQEAIKEAEYQGITVEEAIAAHEVHNEPITSTGGDDEVQPDTVKVEAKNAPKIQRQPPPERLDPEVKYKGLKNDKTSEWGSGEDGYRAPRSPIEKLGRNVPYKYKFKRNFGDF